MTTTYDDTVPNPHAKPGAVIDDLEKMSAQWAQEVIVGLGGKLFSLLERGLAAYERDVDARVASMKTTTEMLANQQLMLKHLENDGTLPRS